jgi:hypothetical protein
MQVNDNEPEEIPAAPGTRRKASKRRWMRQPGRGSRRRVWKKPSDEAELKAAEYHDSRGCGPRPKRRTCAAVRRRTSSKACEVRHRPVCPRPPGRQGQPRGGTEPPRPGTVDSCPLGHRADPQATDGCVRQIGPDRESVRVGEKFDPHRHQAISVVESQQEPNTVVTVLQKGYLLADRVLRPALVVVAKSTSSAT